MEQNQNPFDLLTNRPSNPETPAQPAKPTAPADDPFAAFDKSESLFGDQPKPAQPAQPAAAPNPFTAAPVQPAKPVQPAQPAATPNPFTTPAPAAPSTPAAPAAPVTPAAPAKPIQPTYYTQPTGNSYIPPITPDERANTTVPNYVPNVTGFDAEEPMSVGDWLITMLIMCIPCVNLVMIFVWAFGSGNKSRANYFKATLIWAAILLALYILLIVLFIALGVDMAHLINQ